MIGAIISGFKLVSGFAKAYKWIIACGAVASFALTAFIYVGSHAKMKVLIPLLKDQVEQCQNTNVAFADEIANLNLRINAYNMLRREEIAAAKIVVLKAARIVGEVNAENEQLKLDLGVTRFETLEAIRDDETFADWVDWTVPSAGWRLLRDSAEGNRTPE
jgi:hypothetical protein